MIQDNRGVFTQNPKGRLFVDCGSHRVAMILREALAGDFEKRQLVFDAVVPLPEGARCQLRFEGFDDWVGESWEYHEHTWVVHKTPVPKWTGAPRLVEICGSDNPTESGVSLVIVTPFAQEKWRIPLVMVEEESGWPLRLWEKRPWWPFKKWKFIYRVWERGSINIVGGNGCNPTKTMKKHSTLRLKISALDDELNMVSPPETTLLVKIPGLKELHCVRYDGEQ